MSWDLLRVVRSTRRSSGGSAIIVMEGVPEGGAVGMEGRATTEGGAPIVGVLLGGPMDGAGVALPTPVPGHVPGSGSAARLTGSVIAMGTTTGGSPCVVMLERNTVPKGRPSAQARSCRSC